jgi:hypothetical protein
VSARGRGFWELLGCGLAGLLGFCLVVPGLFGVMFAVLYLLGAPLGNGGKSTPEGWVFLASSLGMAVCGTVFHDAAHRPPAGSGASTAYAVLAACSLIGLTCALVTAVTLVKLMDGKAI